MELKDGQQVTVIGCGSAAFTYRQEITIKYYDPNKGKYVFSHKGKRKKFYLEIDDGVLVFDGWNCPVKVDSMFSRFTGNVLINVVGDERMILDMINNKNLNPKFDKHERVLWCDPDPTKLDADGNRPEKPLFPERYQPGTHASMERVIKRIGKSTTTKETKVYTTNERKEMENRIQKTSTQLAAQLIVILPDLSVDEKQAVAAHLIATTGVKLSEYLASEEIDEDKKTEVLSELIEILEAKEYGRLKGRVAAAQVGDNGKGRINALELVAKKKPAPKAEVEAKVEAPTPIAAPEMPDDTDPYAVIVEQLKKILGQPKDILTAEAVKGIIGREIEVVESRFESMIPDQSAIRKIVTETVTEVLIADGKSLIGAVVKEELKEMFGRMGV